MRLYDVCEASAIYRREMEFSKETELSASTIPLKYGQSDCQLDGSSPIN